MLRYPLVFRLIILVAIANAAASCGGNPSPAPVVSPTLTSSSIDRMTIRRGDQRVEVDSPLVAGRRVEQLAQQGGGAAGAKDLLLGPTAGPSPRARSARFAQRLP